jgi:choline dehydrogenase
MSANIPAVRTYQSPTRLVHGVGAIASLGKEAAALGITRPMVVTDAGIVKAGILDEALEPLRRAGLDPVVFDRVRANPDVALVDEGARYYASEGCDGLVGLGGGSSIDTAKGAGLVAVLGGSILQYEYGRDPIDRRIPPLIAVPTTAGTGSEVTLWAVITDPDRKIKFNVGGTPHLAPWVALIDPALTVNLPPSVTAGTGMDALAHAVECYTMAYHQPFTDAVALQAIEYVSRWLRVAYQDGSNLDARYHMSLAAMLAGMSYGTDSAGAAHAMSQSAGGVHDVPHGDLTGRVLGPVVEYNYLGDPPRFARIAEAMGMETRNLHPTDAAERAVDEVYALTEDVHIPSLQDLGFAEDEIPALAKIAYEDPQTIGNPREVDQGGYEQIYKRAFEVGKR